MCIKDLSQVITLLNQQKVLLAADAEKKLQDHAKLVLEWNAVASLVSSGDAENLWTTQIVDSLSLAPVVQGVCPGNGYLLDIGSGGGFPAIPIKIALPRLRVTLVERSERKIGFLRKAVAGLSLSDVQIIHGDFPACVHREEPDAITARAVEKPEKLIKQIARFMPTRCVFLCQAGDPTQKLPEGFHVEPVEDAWTRSGLRRGALHLVRRRA